MVTHCSTHVAVLSYSADTLEQTKQTEQLSDSGGELCKEQVDHSKCNDSKTERNHDHYTPEHTTWMDENGLCYS